MLFLAEPTFNVSIVFYTLRRSTCSPAKKHTPCALQMQPQQCQHTAHTVPPYSLNADSMLCRTAPVAPNVAPRRSKCIWTCATARARAVTARARAEHRPRAARGHYFLIFLAGGRYLARLGTIPWYSSMGANIYYIWAPFLGICGWGPIFNTSGRYSLVFPAGVAYLAYLGTIPWYSSLWVNI